MEYQTDALVEIINAPIENLRVRINELEKEIQLRQKIRNRVLAELEWQRMKLEDRLNYLKNTYSRKEREKVEMELLNIEREKLQEEERCFDTVGVLKEKLRIAKEELAKKEAKQKLLR